MEEKHTSVEQSYPRTVVIVEDDGFIRSLLAEYLEKVGFLVSTASSAVDARRLIAMVDPDAVVLDIDLGPGPTGLDLADVINVDSNEVGIVFLTNYSDPRFAGRDITAAHPTAAYLNKQMLEDSTVLVEALDAVLLEKELHKFRFDQRADRPLAHLSNSQIQALRLIAEGKTNQQIASIRKRSLDATESLVTRTLFALGISPHAEVNSRVAAAREFLSHASITQIDHES